MVRDDVPAGQADTLYRQYADGEREHVPTCVSPLPTRDVLPARTDSPCRRAPVPSATGEQPCAAECARTPSIRTRCARDRGLCVTPGLCRQLLPAWPSPSRLRARRSPAIGHGDPCAVVRARAGLADGRARAPVRLLTGLRFDVLDCRPRRVTRRCRAAAGTHRAGGAGRGDRMRLLVAAGSAEELPGLLDWLEWGGVALDSDRPGRGRPDRRAGTARRGRRAAGSPGAAGVAAASPSRGARWRPTLPGPRRPRAQGSGMLPISYGSWTRWRRNATGPG